MKKTVLFAAALLAFAACSKESPIVMDNETARENETAPENGIDASEVVFNINVENGDAAQTKGVKTAWEDGDAIYLFFEGNTTQYVRMRFDGTSWNCTDKNGGQGYSGLALASSGETLSAVYIPELVSTAAPAYSEPVWTFGSIGGYFQTAESVAYTVSPATVTDPATLHASISLTAPEHIFQVYIDEPAPSSGNEYILTITNIRPFTFSGIVPGGAASVSDDETVGFPLTGYPGTIGGESGYYFWGINTVTDGADYSFQLVTRHAEKKYALSSKSKTVRDKTFPKATAVKLGGLTDNGKFVNLGYDDTLWATGNLGRWDGSSPISKYNYMIVDPLEAGDFFRYGATAVYRPLRKGTDYEDLKSMPKGQLIRSYYQTDQLYTDIGKMGHDLPLDRDIAYIVSQMESFRWKIPTWEQLKALKTYTSISFEWKSGWTSLGSENGGALVSSKINGVSLFLPAAGAMDAGPMPLGSSTSSDTFVNQGYRGYYWSSTSLFSTGADGGMCWSLQFSGNSFASQEDSMDAYSIRPVLTQIPGGDTGGGGGGGGGERPRPRI